MTETIVLNKRIQSIDLLRGIVMIIIALDQCRVLFVLSSATFVKRNGTWYSAFYQEAVLEK